MMDSSTSKDSHQLEPETKKKMKSDDSQAEDARDDFPEGPQLGVYELCLIFENDWISPRDLISFRMVNKNWCEAATTTLLKRNACCVNLKLDNKKDASTGLLRSFHKLSQLTQLISNSTKFPTSKFSIHTSSKSDSDYSSFPDLLLFFERHGDNIKTLRPHGWITQKLLVDIFFIYTRSLACLDLSKAKFWPSKRGEDKSRHSKYKSQVLPITSLWLGDSWKDNYYPGSSPNDDPKSNDDSSNATERHIVHWLLSTSSKLTCIENVTLDTLGGVLREGKGHLIRSFTYSFSNSFITTSVQIIDCVQRVTSPMKTIMTRFLALKPNLTTVTLEMQHEIEDFDMSIADITLVNALIDSIKDTVQNLTFCFNYEYYAWNYFLKIPPMKNLKWITLEDSSSRIDHFFGDPFDLHLNLIEFDDGISAQNYFPSLKKISLRYQGDNTSYTGEEANLMSFFAFKSGRDDGSVWNSLPNVDKLETDWEVITGLYCTKGAPENTLLPEMFPNIRILKLKCDDLFDKLENRCWIFCPKVEFMEIYGIERVTRDYGAVNYKLSHYVDKFFTGFSLEICERLRTKKLPDEKNNPDMLDFLQEEPSIRQLKHLKELNLQFAASFSTEFASAAVTGENAFAKMPNTKFTFSYDSKIFRRITDQNRKRTKIILLDAEAAVAAEEVCFGSIKPYVQIVHE